jgi:hypothetical protein
MENEEITDESEVVIPDAQEESEELEYETEETSTEPDELAKAQAEANKWRRIAQKNMKKPEVKPTVTSTPSPSVDVDERILKHDGMSDDLLKELKGIAQLRGVSLIDAQNDFLFVAAKEKFEKDAKVQQAQLGASRGSGMVKPKPSFITPNLSRDEHKEMVAKRLG